MTTTLTDLTPTERTIVLALRLHSTLSTDQLAEAIGRPSKNQMAVALRTLRLAQIIARTEDADGHRYSIATDVVR